MDTPAILIAQSLADEWTLIAQKYAGYFYGHPVRAGQTFGKAPQVWVEADKVWEEPLVFPDDCQFCQITTDDRVRARVKGYQKAIDIEVRNYSAGGSYWGVPANAWLPDLQSIQLTELPFHLQKRLCIEWNHAFKAWLDSQTALEYDFEEHALRIKGAKDSPLPLVAADAADLAALVADQEADRVFAATLPTAEALSLADQIAAEYELDL
jgi:hypothetical protein